MTVPEDDLTRIVLVVHGTRPSASRLADRIAAEAESRGIEVVERIEIVDRILPDMAAGPPVVDAVVAVGGDGTVLSAVQIAIALDAPVVGVNVGRVGFLADVDPEAVPDALELLAGRAWPESSRMTVEARVLGPEEDGARPVRARLVGLNDVVVEKVVSQRLVSLAVEVDDEPFLVYHADGIVFATSTGSTAYSLSAGGPLVDPDLDALLLTPVAPHGLFAKSLVFPPDRVLACTVVEDRPVGVSVDGFDLGSFEPGTRIEVRRGGERVRFVDVSGRSFVRRVKDKFRLNDLARPSEPVDGSPGEGSDG